MATHRRAPSAPPEPPDGAPESVEEALARARRHGRASLAEATRALGALLDAGALAASGEPAESHHALGLLAGLLERLAKGLEDEPREDAASLLAAVAEALDVEIARWEERAREEPEARAVLRAFLGLRELLWEFGVRRAPAGAGDRRRSGTRRREGPRVQRVSIREEPGA